MNGYLKSVIAKEYYNIQEFLENLAGDNEITYDEAIEIIIKVKNIEMGANKWIKEKAKRKETKDIKN